MGLYLYICILSEKQSEVPPSIFLSRFSWSCLSIPPSLPMTSNDYHWPGTSCPTSSAWCAASCPWWSSSGPMSRTESECLHSPQIINHHTAISIFRGGVTAGGGDRMTGDSIALLSAALSGLMQVSGVGGCQCSQDGIKLENLHWAKWVKNAWST